MSKWLNGFSFLQNVSRFKEKITYVDTEKTLKHIVERLKNEKEIAVDTEGNSLYCYQSKICLIQVSSREKHYIIDTLRIKNISILKDLFSNPNVEKIMHGSAYDIQMLYQCAGIQIKNLFDTQIAASFLGEKKPGLASIIKKYFGVHLSKTHQKSNWAIRPLPDEMIEYAISDTMYLLFLADRLKKQLKENHRIEWVREECEYLSRYGINIKKKERPSIGIENPSGEKLNAAELVLQFREKVARQMNLPPFRVLDKKTIREIVVKENLDIKTLKWLTAKTPLKQHHLEELLEIIQKAGEKIVKRQEKQTSKKYHTKDFKEKIDKLYTWRSTRAQQLGLEPYLVLSQKQILSLAEVKIETHNDIAGIDELKNWQKKTFGKELTELLK
ncbi:MAG: HRDC domain-containing protein [bacterium]|nr:HRDC domain-containing protein [bacterium]